MVLYTDHLPRWELNLVRNKSYYTLNVRSDQDTRAHFSYFSMSGLSPGSIMLSLTYICSLPH